MWIDVKKAFDSVKHDYLIECISKLNFSPCVLRFLKSIISKWKIDIKTNNETILKKRIERGILQGDSLSPLLFVLCLDPLSRWLNENFPKVTIKTENESHTTNHLIFIDDLKLLATSDIILTRMMNEAKIFLNSIGLEINPKKSATNSIFCSNDGELLEGTKSYKYLGIIEDCSSKPTEESLIKIRREIIKRVDRLCKTNLNAKNLFKAINEHAISIINYHIGVLKLDPKDFAEIDHEIRQALTKYEIHKQPACKERLYMSREELGRGLNNVEMRSEHMLVQLYSALNDHKKHLLDEQLF